MTIITYQYFERQLAFRLHNSRSEGCTGIFKKKKNNDSWGSVTAGDEMLRLNFKNLEVGLGEKNRSDQCHPTYIHVWPMMAASWEDHESITGRNTLCLSFLLQMKAL